MTLETAPATTETTETTTTDEQAAAPAAPAANLADAAKATEEKPAAPAEAPKTEEKPAAVIPASADQYDFTLPDLGLKDEKGEPFQFAKDDPLVNEARGILFEGKVGQETASKLMGLYAKAVKESVAAKTQADAALSESRITAELAKLETKTAEGKAVTGGERVQNLLTAVNAVLGDGASSKIGPALINADVVVEIEKLIAAANEGGAGKGKPAPGERTAAQRMYGG